MKRITTPSFCALFAIAIGACSDRPLPSGPDVQIPDIPSGLIVSDPVHVNLPGGMIRATAYVSALPGTFHGGFRVTLRNETRNSAPVTLQLSDGGFDPVAIEAFVGDEISRTVDIGSGQLGPLAKSKVPATLRPQLLRTSPRPGTAGFSLDGAITAVFSEPIDETSLLAGAIALKQDAIDVGGVVQISTERLTLEFRPFDRLNPETAYTAVIDARISDLDGERLVSTSVVSFSTEEGEQPPEGEPPPAAALDASLELSFVSEQTGNTEIFKARADGSNVMQLTSNQGYDGEAAWSPDGSRIAFVSARQRNANGALIDDTDIYVMNADGSNVIRLTTTGSARRPTWSPDGSELAYEYDPYPMGAGDIAVLNVSSDPSRVVTCQGDSISGPNPRYLGLRSLDAYHPVWSPDGSRIAFASDPSWPEIRSVTRCGGTVSTLLGRASDAKGPLGFSRPTWSPDGSRVAAHFCRGHMDECDKGIGIVMTSADGSGFGYILDDPDVWPGDLAWSPDGAAIAFQRGRCDTRGCGNDLAYVTLDHRRLGFIIEDAREPAWRPRPR